MAVRRLLRARASAPPFDAPLVMQFSSLSSVGERGWLRELSKSLCGGDGGPTRLRVVYPSRAEICESLEGWFAGDSLPCKNGCELKLLSALREMSGGSNLATLCHWDGGPDGGARKAAVPHIKSYCRYGDDGRSLAFALLTSSNLSQAAWGVLEKGNSQLYIKSYELGILLLPSLQPSASPPTRVPARSPAAPATIVPLRTRTAQTDAVDRKIWAENDDLCGPRRTATARLRFSSSIADRILIRVRPAITV